MLFTQVRRFDFVNHFLKVVLHVVCHHEDALGAAERFLLFFGQEHVVYPDCCKVAIILAQLSQYRYLPYVVSYTRLVIEVALEELDGELSVVRPATGKDNLAEGTLA
jgi:hypothetical protein